MKWLLTILAISLAVHTSAQQYVATEDDVSELLDEIVAVPDQDLNYDELYENLVQRLTHPLDLNLASADDFRSLQFLSEVEINGIIDYRIDNPFLSVYELQSIRGFDPDIARKLAAFVTVRDPTERINGTVWKRIKKQSDNYLLVRYDRTLQQRKGFSDGASEGSKFKGNADRYYLRFRCSKPGDFSFGITAEKDPGEQFLWNTRERYFGADFLSYYLQLQNKGRIQNLIVGNFQAQYGQGLVFGGVFGMGKGGETITNVRSTSIGVLPYTSAFEAGAMHGVALTIKGTRHFTITTLFSTARKDASFDSLEGRSIITSLPASGLHRNQSEQQKRKTAREQNAGIVLRYKLNHLDAGLMFSHTAFNGFLRPKPTAYNQFTFTGEMNQNIGVFASYSYNNISISGEVAHSVKGGQAMSIGLLASVHPRFDVSFLYRRFDRNFYSFYSSAFSEGSSVQNETGIYYGWKYTFNRRYQLAGYTDIFRFPWLRFRSYSPNAGYEWLIRFNYTPSRKVKIFLQARQEYKGRNVDTDSLKQYVVIHGKKSNYWISFDYTLSDKLRFKSRLQFSNYHINGITTSGVALVHDLLFSIHKFKVSMRYAVFDTEDYDNRQYVYENDVWLAYSMPAYNGVGIRKMMIVSYKFNKHLNLSVRYARTRYQQQETIGSGLDQIDGNERDDVKAQIVFRF